MVVSSFSPIGVCLGYLTVFRSRLGLANLVLSFTDYAFQADATLERKLVRVLGDRVYVSGDLPPASSLASYLDEKKMFGAKGRYAGFKLTKVPSGYRLEREGEKSKAVPIFKVDLCMLDEAVRSTIGVPTVDNVAEIVDLTYQLGVIGKAKNTWTAAGQMIRGLRGDSRENPFVLGPEVAGLLRQVLTADGLLLCEMLHTVAAAKDSIVRRDAVADQFGDIVARALERARSLKYAPAELAHTKQLLSQVEQATKRTTTAKGSRGPGILEHRVSPRLEWLTDVGALSKDGMKRNAFSYCWTADADLLLEALEDSISKRVGAADAALSYWRQAASLATLRREIPAADVRTAILRGYRVMERPIGPAPIAETCFAAGVLGAPNELCMSDLERELLSWASEKAGVAVSGGRLRREPELVHVSRELLRGG